MSHLNRIPGAVLNRRVFLQDSLMTTSQKAYAKALREAEKERSLREEETRAYMARVAAAQVVLDKETAERRFFSTPSEEGRRQTVIREREVSRTRGDLRVTPFTETLQAFKEAKELDDWGREVSQLAEERRREIAQEAEIVRLNEEFQLLCQETSREVFAQAVELADLDLRAPLSWEGLESLQEAIEVALEL